MADCYYFFRSFNAETFNKPLYESDYYSFNVGNIKFKALGVSVKTTYKSDDIDKNKYICRP